MFFLSDYLGDIFHEQNLRQVFRFSQQPLHFPQKPAPRSAVSSHARAFSRIAQILTWETVGHYVFVAFRVGDLQILSVYFRYRAEIVRSLHVAVNFPCLLFGKPRDLLFGHRRRIVRRYAPDKPFFYLLRRQTCGIIGFVFAEMQVFICGNGFYSPFAYFPVLKRYAEIFQSESLRTVARE